MLKTRYVNTSTCFNQALLWSVWVFIYTGIHVYICVCVCVCVCLSFHDSSSTRETNSTPFFLVFKHKSQSEEKIPVCALCEFRLLFIHAYARLLFPFYRSLTYGTTLPHGTSPYVHVATSLPDKPSHLYVCVQSKPLMGPWPQRTGDCSWRYVMPSMKLRMGNVLYLAN